MPISQVDYEPTAAAVIAEVVKDTKELEQPTARQSPASREMAAAPSPQPAPPESDAVEGSSLPSGRTSFVDKAVAPVGAGPEMAPVPPPEEQAENVARPEWPGAGIDFRNRFDSAQGRIGNHGQNTEELEALLDQAVTLLESVSQHPAIRDYGANKRKLEEIEQRLNCSGNVL
jgi:hypothetical protein